MRVVSYIAGSVLCFVAVLIILVAVNSKSSDAFAGYGIGSGLLFWGLGLIIAAFKMYRGGFFYILGLFTIALFIFASIFTAFKYDLSNKEAIITGSVVSTVILSLGLLFIWLGHRRHLRLPPLTTTQSVESSPLTHIVKNQTASGEPVTENSTPPILYPPMALWRVFLLMVFSWTIYSAFLAYRTIRDLNQLGKKKLEPGSYAFGALIPVIGYFIFYEMASSISQLSKKVELEFKLNPAALTGLMILASYAPLAMPSFLFPLSISIATIPWVLLHAQMNALRLATTSQWHQPENGYTWNQRSVLIIGLPLMALILIGGKTHFQHFSGSGLSAGQTLTGLTPIYQLHITGSDWRQVKVGTLYPDTDLELMGKTPQDWVVVRTLPNQQKPLDTFVDARREMVASNWKKYTVTESRTLDSGGKLIPISLAHYSSEGAATNFIPSFHVATIVTPDHAIEVIGQQTKNGDSAVQTIVESLRLTPQGDKP